MRITIDEGQRHQEEARLDRDAEVEPRRLRRYDRETTAEVQRLRSLRIGWRR